MLKAFSWLLAVGLVYSHSAQAKKCTYSPDPNSLQVQWTAFKTTQKVAVSGKFTTNKTLKKLEKSYSSLASLLKAAAVQVDMTSVDSGNPQRDETLKTQFFALLKEHSLAHASLDNIKEKADHSGTADMNLKFNDQTKKVPVTFAYENGVITLKGQMDILNYTASTALESLNKACHDLHKGADGVSKTWSEVDFSISGQVTEKCQ